MNFSFFASNKRFINNNIIIINNIIISVFEEFFSQPFSFFPENSINFIENINIFEIIKLNSEPKIPEVLNKIKNFNAPILLRKYLYDFISKNGLEYAKNECLSLISEKPFIQYKRICSLL